MKHLECINACYVCASACESCVKDCLYHQEVKAMARCIELARTGADVCSLAAREMARDSEFAPQISLLCALICKSCGDECADHDSEACRRCAVACHRCADECRLTAAA